MKYFNDLFFEGTRLRREAIEDARAAGRLGCNNIPAGALTAVPDPSDTFVGELLGAFEEGQAERAQRKQEAQS